MLNYPEPHFSSSLTYCEITPKGQVLYTSLIFYSTVIVSFLSKKLRQFFTWKDQCVLADSKTKE